MKHSDITFEAIPADYACLIIRTQPEVGGDTLWASAYDAYDRLSPNYKTLLDGLTAEHSGTQFADLIREKDKNPLARKDRGAPENTGPGLTATHPVIRTNPVTGWKGLFVNRSFTKKINGLTQAESDNLIDFLCDIVSSVSDCSSTMRLMAESRYTNPIQMEYQCIGYMG